jgi:hypothetical protein
MRKRRMGCPTQKLGTKVRLVASLNASLAALKLTQAEAARVPGVNQPKVSALKWVQAGGVFGGAADALRYGAGA